MAEPFLAEIRIFGFNFAPRGWAQCDGQILPILQNQSLYSLLGTTYGGDGRTSFGLPELRGRTPVHTKGNDFRLGQKGGEETRTLSQAEMPQHKHVVMGTTNDGTGMGGATTLGDNLLASTPNQVYRDPGTSNVGLRAGTSAGVGGDQAHENMQPYLALNFCIALQGTFPSRN